jgi:GDP-4-dehydro-6-deoxy-D-mannose reductase
MPVWLVTGAAGFLGRSIVAELTKSKRHDVTLVATARTHTDPLAGTASATADLEYPRQVDRLCREYGPSVVLHLAGRTPPASADEFYRGNLLGTLHLLDSLRALGHPVRIVLASSAAELGPVTADQLPTHEDHPCRPAGAYGLSKWLATQAGLAASAPLEVMVARIFNPIGPGLPESQAFGRFARLLAEPGPDPLVMDVGELEATRDFVDVRDVARAVVGLAVAGRPGLIYHVGSGESRSVRDGLERLIELSGREVVVRVDHERARRQGPSHSRAAIDRITSHIGWRPEIGWEASLNDLWAAARREAGCH